MFMSTIYHTKLGEGRRVSIPAEACLQLGIHPGDPVSLEFRDGHLQIIPYERIIREIQAEFASFRQPGESVVDELIRERRAEAEREDRA